MAQKIILATILFASMLFATAHVCNEELSGAYSDEELRAKATGEFAANLLRRALELVEPALPPFVLGRSLLGQEADRAYQDAIFLTRRNLLPKEWDPGVIDTSVWRAMIGAFVQWYGVDGVPATVPSTNADLLRDLTLALARVATALRPLAVITTLDHDATKVGAIALIWNWSVYPRLIVFRPTDEVLRSVGPGSVLQHLETCAIKVTNWILVSEGIAQGLFLLNDNTKLYLVASIPP
jgi:hypothetical protein